MTLPDIDVTPFSQVEVDFYFYVRSMENGEDFWLRFFDGSTWSTVATWTQGVDINNNTFYQATVNISSAQYNFAANSGFRFQNDASGNNDYIYIDQVTISGISGTGKNTDKLIALSTSSRPDDLNGDLFEHDEIKIYPNPTTDILNIKFIETGLSTRYRIMNILGKMVRNGEIVQDKIDVSALQNGIYFLEVNDGEEVTIKRFIKE